MTTLTDSADGAGHPDETIPRSNESFGAYVQRLGGLSALANPGEPAADATARLLSDWVVFQALCAVEAAMTDDQERREEVSHLHWMAKNGPEDRREEYAAKAAALRELIGGEHYIKEQGQ